MLITQVCISVTPRRGAIAKCRF